MTNLPEQIASLLIPMVGRPLLVPNVTVAEIVNWRNPEVVTGMPRWVLGVVDWRGVNLPVLSIEAMNDPGLEDIDCGERLVVINAQGESKLPFYGLAVQGIPRLVRVFPDEIGEQETMSDDAVYDMLVMVSGERAIIPDLIEVEKRLNLLEF